MGGGPHLTSTTGAKRGVLGHDPEVLRKHLPTIADHLDDEFAM